jgi:CO/xanthine dehydrogenase FAD-binding subunit
VLSAGAAVNHQKLMEHETVRRVWGAIYDSVESVGHTRIRRMMTVGGTIGPLIGGFDFPVALIALHGRVLLASAAGRRTITLQDLFETRLAPHEMVVAVEVDTPPARTGSAFLKLMPRGVIETPSVNAAAAVTLDSQGRIAGSRLVIGSVSWKPIVLDLGDAAGEAPGEALFRKLVQPVRDLAQPMANVRGSIMYKRNMAVEFACRALREAARRAAA